MSIPANRTCDDEWDVGYDVGSIDNYYDSNEER
jgi:hypothetical protein